MAQEDQTQNCSNSSSGGGIGSLSRSSKKSKQKKVSQRGLGVAELEKIRLEEQQMKDAAVAAAAILPSPSSVSSSKSSYLSSPIPNSHHSNQPSSPIPFPSGSPADFKVPNTVSLANCGAFETGRPAVPPVPGHGNVSKLWNSYEYDSEKEGGFRMVGPGLAFCSSNISLPYDSNPIWPLSNCAQGTQQYHKPSSTMVNVSPGNSSAPAIHYSMEPPSNQNYSSSCMPMPLEEKMIGMKRSYPFSLDVPPTPSFNFKLPTFAAPMKTNEAISFGSGTGFNFDAGSSTFREVPSCSTSNSQPNSKKSNEGNGSLNGDFLTLAPPTPTSCTASKFKSAATFPAFHNPEYLDFESLSYHQGNIEDQIPPNPGFSRFNQQQHQPFYSFFPPVAKTAQIGQTTSRIQNCNGEVGETVDLNLKL